MALVDVWHCKTGSPTQVLLADEPVSTRKVMLSVLDPSKVTAMTIAMMMMTMMMQVSHKTQYVIKKAGGNVTLDCTDFTGEQEAAWRKIGGKPSLILIWRGIRDKIDFIIIQYTLIN